MKKIDAAVSKVVCTTYRMTFFTVQQLARAALPLRTMVRYDAPGGRNTAIVLASYILELKRNGEYIKGTKKSYPTLEEWCATLPEGAAENLFIQTPEDYWRGRVTNKLPGQEVAAKAAVKEIISLIKQQKPSDIDVLTEILNKLRATTV